MTKIKHKITYVSLMFIILFVLSMTQPSSASFEFKVRTGASMEYEVTDVKIAGNNWMQVWLLSNNGSYLSIDVTKGTKIKADVTNGTATEVTGTILVTEGSKTLTTTPISLEFVSFGQVSLPIVQQTTDKATWQQIANTPNQQLQGNILTTKWKWEQNDGIWSQETRMNVISGFVEFFAFIFLVNESIDEIFSMTRSSPVVPGFEIPTIVVPFIALAIIIRVKSKRET
ncbi:MAG: hypothetical protein HeimC3_13130 [Candidatus Heimdallarchaeota archaeon LC_3]|nr:MAG: hypothetical protein HeimC3_13130 [Candidatus Heimdallarchaeota archaeon LC_3]